MAQDLREVFKDKNATLHNDKKLPKGHQERFINRLNEQLPQEAKPSTTKKFFTLKIAAALVILLAASWFTYQQFSPVKSNTPTVTSTEKQTEEKPVYLSDISPEYKKIEDYYLGNINAELAQLSITKDNKELIDSFMQQLSELDNEYKNLNAELNDAGVTEETISALINNLELRLELLYKLKSKLSEIKKSNLSEVQENNA